MTSTENLYRLRNKSKLPGTCRGHVAKHTPLPRDNEISRVSLPVSSRCVQVSEAH